VIELDGAVGAHHVDRDHPAIDRCPDATIASLHFAPPHRGAVVVQDALDGDAARRWAR